MTKLQPRLKARAMRADSQNHLPVIPVRDDGYWRLRLLLAEIERLMMECKK